MESADIYTEKLKKEHMESVQEETHEEVLVERLQETRMETYTTVELFERDELPRVEKCCFCIHLRIGLGVWVILEALLWVAFFVAALYHEIIYVNEDDLMLFSLRTDQWYFELIFGDRLHTVDQKIRSKKKKLFFSRIYVTIFFFFFTFPAYIVLINFILMLVFLTYLAFCIVLILGIIWVIFLCKLLN